MADIKMSQLIQWLSQDDEDAGENAIQELFGIISGSPVQETIDSIKGFLESQND